MPYYSRDPKRDAQEAHLVWGIPAVDAHALHGSFGGVPVFEWYTQVLQFLVLTVFLSVAAAV